MNNILKNVKKKLTNKKRRAKAIIYMLLLLLLVGLIWLSLFFFKESDSSKIAEIEGISVYTSDKNSKQDIIRIIDTCMLQLKNRGIEHKFKESVIFCTNTKEYNRKTFFRGGGTLAKNIYFLKKIVCAPANFSTNRQYPRDKNLCSRRLSDVLAHELTHSYMHEKLGLFRLKKMMISEKWKSEGFGEYIANSSSLNIDDGKRIFMENGKEQADIESGKDIWKWVYFYFKSRLKVDYLLSYKKISFDDFINTKFDEQKLENEIREALQKRLYTFNKQ